VKPVAVPHKRNVTVGDYVTEQTKKTIKIEINDFIA
jgi:hypothetical protein